MVRSRSFWVLILASLFAVTTLTAGDADARRKRKKRAKKQKITRTANVEALQELMGAFKFGMSHKQVISVVRKQIAERYAEEISATNDVYKQDALRRKRDKEIARTKKSLVKFDGTKSGWDVSLIDDQFAHKSEESMMVHWETHQGRNQRRFFFFFEGRLYKMFIALDTSALKQSQRNFKFFRSLMENRFGEGIVHPAGITWLAKRFRVDALDKLAFYNSFCLVISDRKIRTAVAKLREKTKAAPKRNTIIEAMTEGGDDEAPGLDEGAGAIDDLLKD